MATQNNNSKACTERNRSVIARNEAISSKESKSLIPKLRFKEFEDDWEQKKLGDISTFSKGKNISKADIIEDGNLECIRYGELYTVYNEIIENIKSKTNLKACDLVLSESNDVIIPASGETQIDIATASCVLKDGVALGGDLNIIKSKVNGVFLSYYLNSKRKIDIARLSQGISVVHLYSSQLKTLNLNLPKEKEQQKIANFLTAVDTKLQQLTTKKEKLAQYKKGVMQQLFSQQLRFKDDDGSDFPDWEEKRLKDFVKINQGLQIAISDRYTEPVENGYFYITNEFLRKKSEKQYFIKNPPNSVICDKDDILMTRTGNTGQVVTGVKGAFHNNFFKIKFDSSCYKNFLYYFLTSVKTQHIIMSLAGTSTIPDLNHGDFYKIEINYPSLKEQKKIANYLSAIDTKIEKVKTQITKTQAFKKGLLQQMFV